jgi:GT2 family glycosyltransferase
MDRAAPKVSIVIPNHNGVTPRDGLEYLRMVLSSISSQDFQDFDLTVVDDGSDDGSVSYLKREWPRVRVIALAGNSGFPAVVNRGIEATLGTYIALLNNDLELSADWLGSLVGELDRNPELGFVTGKVLRYDRREVIEQAGQDLYTCGRFMPRGIDEKDMGQYDVRCRVPIATAAASLYRRSAVERAGCFDEDYFLYCEDADLCLRIWLSGYEGLYVPGPAAYHVRGGTVGQETDLARFWVQRNRLVTMLKDVPGSILWRSLLKIALFERHEYVLARQAGATRTFLRSYASFLRAIPRTLRKRRRIAARREIPVARFRELLIAEYPFPTRFTRQAP